MSYIVESILMHRMSIEDDINLDIESPEFEALLSIKCAINKLMDLQLIGEKDVKLLLLAGENPYWDSIAKELNSNRVYVMKRFFDICKLISKYLGDEFNDEALVAYLKNNIYLSDDQLNKATQFLNSKRKWSTY